MRKVLPNWYISMYVAISRTNIDHIYPSHSSFTKLKNASRHIVVFTLLTIVLSLKFAGFSYGQTTTVFTDNFNRAALNTGGPTTYSIVREIGTGIGVATANTDVLDFVSPGSQGGSAYAVGALSAFSAPFNATLHSNPGLVTWSFNANVHSKAPTGSTSGGTNAGFQATTGSGTTKTGMGVILVTTATSSFTTTGTGYAIVNVGNNSGLEYDFVKFTGGIGGTLTVLQSFSTSAQKTWVDIKVTYDPISGTWTYYFNDEAQNNAAATNDPSTFAYTSSLTSTDATYTMTAMSSFAFGACYTNSSGNHVYYDNFKCTVLNSCAAAITTSPSNPTAVCTGTGTPSFTVVATGTGLTYQWYESTNGGTSYSGTALTTTGVYSGTGTATLVITNPPYSMNGYVYKAVVNGCAISTGATLTVNPSSPTINTPPSSFIGACSGTGAATFTVAATNATSYQWQESTTGSGGTFNNVTNTGIYSGVTTATLTITNPVVTMNGYAYRVVVGGACSNTNSNGAALLSFVTAPGITTQPANPTAVCAGTGVSTFTVVASGGGTFTYQWYQSTDGGLTFPTLLTNAGVYSGTATASLVITAPPVTMNNYQYKAVVTNCSGFAPTNGNAKLTVGAALGTITAPANSTEYNGGSTTFTVNTNPGLTYQWQYSATGTAGTFANVATGAPSNFTYTTVSNSGTGTSTLTVATTSAVVGSTVTNYYYQCAVSNGSCASNSNTATLQVYYQDPTLTSISPGSTTEGSGGFTLTVNGTNFISGKSVVYWNGVALTTTFVSSTQMTATVPTANVAIGTGGTTPNVTVVTTGAINPSGAQTFTINAAATGCAILLSSYTIDPTIAASGTNFTTFTSAVNMLNTSCTSSRTHPITFYVKAGQTFTENVPAIKVATSPIAANYISFITDGSSATHPLIQSGVGTGAGDAIVTIQGTNYIVFDGIDLQDNVANTTANARAEYGYFLITNTNNSSATIGAQYDTIRNCIVTLNKANTNRTFGVLQSGVGGTPNIGNLYTGITVYNAFTGIALGGSSSAIETGNSVVSCIIGPATSGANNIGGAINAVGYGIGVSNQNGSVIHDNIVRNLSVSTANLTAGIYAIGIGTGTLNIYQNTISNISNTNSSSSAVLYGIYITSTATSNIYLNKVYNLTHTGTSSSNTVSGIYIAPAASTTTNIFSNCISALIGSSTSSNRTITGLYFDSKGTSAAAKATGNIYFNSIWFGDSYATGIVDFYTAGQYTSLNVKENIFKYNGTQTNTSNKAYCVYYNDGVAVLNAEDYNIYDMIKLATPYFIGYDGSTAQATLVAWKNATGKDVSSLQFFTQFVSSSDLHLSAYPSSSYTGLLSDASSISPSIDIDGQARTTPTIGADEISITTSPVVVISAPSQPVEANIAKGITGQLIGQYSLAAFSATSGSNADPVLNGATFTIRTVAPMAAPADFSNFKLTIYDASSFTSYGVQATYSTAVSYNAYGDATVPFTLSTPFDLTGGDTYYLYITCDVSASAPTGSNIYVDSSYASSFSFIASDGGPVTKITPSIIDTAGKQTICTFYYNTSTLDSYNITNNPSIVTSNIDDINGWRVKKTNDGLGMGGTPPNFTNDYQVFNIIRNGATFSTTSSTWNLSGNFSRAIVGDGSTTPVRFIVPAGNTITDTVDVLINGTLQLFTTPIINSLTLGALSDHSTVEFSSNSTQTIPVANYGNIVLDSAGDRIFATGVVGIKDTLKMLSPTAANVSAATGSTVNFNGATPQIIPGYNHNNFIYYNLNINNTNAITTVIGENPAVAESIYVSDSLTMNKSLTVPAKDSIIFTAATQGVLVNAGALLQVNGAIVNNAIGAIFNTSTASCQFNTSSIFRLASADNTNGSTSTPAQIPLATWKPNSTCLITGILGTSGNDYVGLGGNYQAFANFVINCPNLVGKLLLTNAANSGFSADTLRITNTGSNPSGHPGFVQIPRQGTQETVNVKYYVQESGYVTIAQNISSGGSRVLNVANDFTVYDNLPSVYPSKFELMNTTSSNTPPWYGKLAVGGNFYMAPTATLSQGKTSSTQTATADISFNGSAGNQNASFGIIFGNINFEVNKTPVAGGKDTVKLLTNTIADSFYLTKGVFSIGSNTLTVNGPANTVYSPGTGTFAGSQTSNLTIGSAAFGASTTGGTLKFASNIAGAAYNNYLQKLSLYGNTSIAATATLGNALNIVSGTGSAPGVVSVGGAGLLTTAGFLTLKSDINGTARVDSNTIATTSYISGNVTIERYYPSHRSWRLVSVPIIASGAPTIKASWQEGASNTNRLSPVDPHPGYGTIITKTTSSVNGYDQGSTSNPSIYYYNAGAWIPPSGTSGTTAGTNSGVITDQSGYMLFVRGGRNYIVTTQYQAPTSTTLRLAGGLKQGAQAISGTGTTVVGNPFASTIYYDGVISRGTNVPVYYYTWDPLMTGSNGVGSFILMTKTGTHTYAPVPDPSTTDPLNQSAHSIATDGRIESGQAVITYFTNPSNPAPGSSSIVEADKGIINDNLVFRPADTPDTPADDISEQFRTNLYAENSDGTTSLEDGVLDVYNNIYSDSVNFLEDAPKLGNISETIALFRQGHNLAIESRKVIGFTDTVYYSLFGMQQKTYIMQFQATNLDHPGLAGFLIDSFLHTRTPLSLVGTTNYKFAITNTASAASHRFTVIFIPVEGGPLPVTFTSIKASAQTDKNIAVQWNVENQLGIKAYQVQKSTDGTHFTVENTTTAIGGNVSSLTYNWVDSNAVTGDNYYRIMSIGLDGIQSYSHIADVKLAKTGLSSIAVYPNPVTGKTIGLQLANAPTGIYGLKLTTDIGQSVFTTDVKHSVNSVVESVQLNKVLAKGVYTLEVTFPDNTTQSIKIIAQ